MCMDVYVRVYMCAHVCVPPTILLLSFSSLHCMVGGLMRWISLAGPPQIARFQNQEYVCLHHTS